MKVYDKAANEALELSLDLRDYFSRDGLIDPHERRLLAEARSVCCATEATATCARVGQRMAGGGALDKNLRRQVDDTLRLMQETNRTIKDCSKPCPVGAELRGDNATRQK